MASENRANNKRNSVENTQGGENKALELTEKRAEVGPMVPFEKTPPGIPPLPPMYVSPRKKNKRSKKGIEQDEAGEEEERNKTSTARSAGSSEERRWDQ